MSPYTSHRQSQSAPSMLMQFGTFATAIALGLGATGAIALPGFSQVPTNDSGDVIIDSGAQTPSRSPSQTIPPVTSSSNRFSCQMSNGQYTVMYQPESQPGQMYPWAVPSALGGGWDSARRCNEITRRLEAYRPDGLQEMKTGVENGYNTICVTTQRIPGCRIVLTVPPGQDPIVTRDRVFQNLTVADSGQQTQGVNTFVGSNRGGIMNEVGRWLGIGSPSRNQNSASYLNAINLRPFLDRADGGTGQLLRSRAAAPGRRLNPNNFR